jgi:quinol monooxygenase YgiN
MFSGSHVGYDRYMLVHSVYFWFKPDADLALVAAFDAGLKRLASIPGIVTAYIGRPETTPKRAVVDDSYAWALVEVFADLAAHDRYQDHPIHQEFLREFSGSWQRVQVYDVRASGS